jgi:anthranilate phosphoribosyltransferase
MGTSLVLEVLGMAKDAKQGIEIAASAIDGGAAKKLLDDLNVHFGKA